MTHDGANGIDLEYNSLNLIKKASQNDAILANYSYLANGTKLAATNAAGDGLVYAGSLVYKKQGNSLNLESAAFSGGRFIANQTSAGTIFTPQYYLTDHLGSTRVVMNAAGDVLERNDYYPFGLRIDKADYEIADNRYRYNGKEEQGFVNVPFIDYGARMYDAKYRMSWNTFDPLAEQQHPVSPFSFCGNNPILRIDLNGMMDDKYYNEKGEMIYDTGVGDKAFVIKTSNNNLVGAACIDKIVAQETEQKISSGQLEGNHMQNVVEIVPIATLKVAKTTIKDDGTGSHPRKPDNQRETGGNILKDNNIANVTQGPMRGSNGKLNASVNIPYNSNTKATYHSHPSGTVKINGEENRSSAFPSLNDYRLAGDRINYIFQMRDNRIIIYNNTNIVATLPFTVLK